MSRKSNNSPVVVEEVAQKEVPVNAPEMTISERLAARIAAAKVQAAVLKAEADAKALLPKAEKPKFAKELPLCGCGCGQLTSGGTYRPGHDAKHKSQLFKLADEGSEEAIEQLEAKGWLHLKAIAKPKAEAKVTRRIIDEWADEAAKQMSAVING